MRTRGRRAGATLGVVLGLALLVGLVAAVAGRPSSVTGPVYTVAEVRAGLARQPTAWAGRTLLVRGVAAGSFWVTGPTTSEAYFCDPGSMAGHLRSCPLAAPHGGTVYLTLIDDSIRLNPGYPLFILPHRTTTTLILAVQPVASNPLIVLARRLPPLARFLPTQGHVPGGVSRLYRVRLRPTGSAPCAPLSFTCATGVLVDAQP